jgi:hypothetical protein
MLDKARESELWHTIEQLDRTQKRQLIEALRRSLADEADRAKVRDAAAMMDAIRARARAGDESVVDLIREGRRY